MTLIGQGTKLDLFDDRAEIELAAHSAVIKALGKRVISDVIEIGARLTACKKLCGHGNWLPWLDREFGWTEQHARKFMHVAEMSKSNNLFDLDIPVSGLYLLAAPSTPETARETIIEHAQNGEALTLDQVKQMIADARKDESDKYERRLADAQAKYKAEADQLREDLKGALSPEAIEQAVDEALEPMREKIRRLEEEKEKRKRETKTFKDEYASRSGAIESALRWLAKELTITPEQMLEHKTLLANATGQQLSDVLADDIKHVRSISKWIERFQEVCK